MDEDEVGLKKFSKQGGGELHLAHFFLQFFTAI